ncbi:hypothetical protein SNE40_008384 [Patella caerulea]|uniref:Uncharacterized protein n=1 Tax=Patella caerulea TaxID=87958 RepID=A0AAN8QAB8_PATCE
MAEAEETISEVCSLSMKTSINDSKTSPKDLPTYVLIQAQIQDVFKTQVEQLQRLNEDVCHQKSVLEESLLTREDEKKNMRDLQATIKDKYVPKEEFEKILLELQTERYEHARTRNKLTEVTDKLEFSLGEIEILTKQLEREKLSFEASYNSLKNKTVQMSNRQKDVESKWTETKTRCKNLEVKMHDKDEEIKRLQNLLVEQNHKYKQKVGEIDVEKQQEQYIAQMMEGTTNKKLGNSRKIGSKR